MRRFIVLTLHSACLPSNSWAIFSRCHLACQPSARQSVGLRADLPRALRAQGHAIANILLVRPPVVLGVLAFARLPAALGAGHGLVVGHAAEASRLNERRSVIRR
jgi:hypothetical protein